MFEYFDRQLCSTKICAFKDMNETMIDADGTGLAAPQVHVRKRVHGLDAVFSGDVVPNGSDIGQVAFDGGLR